MWIAIAIVQFLFHMLFLFQLRDALMTACSLLVVLAILSGDNDDDDALIVVDVVVLPLLKLTLPSSSS